MTSNGEAARSARREADHDCCFVMARIAAVGSILCCLGGCARGAPGSTGATPEEDQADPITLRGSLVFEARAPTLKGASVELERRPARYVEIEVLDQGGAVLVKGSTNDRGQFEIPSPPEAHSVAVVARIRSKTHDIAVTRDIDGTLVHRFSFPLTRPVGANPISLVALDAAEGAPAGALHILDTMMKGLEAAERWTQRQMPPIYVYWGRGVTSSWSYYRGERPPGSGRYGFELLGGQPGQHLTTDTDEHDEAIMVHELGHLVMDLVSTDSSLGGRHPPGVLVDPGLAWEEGRVSWFATAVLNDPLYQDTIGVQPHGKLRVNRDYSRINPGPRGNGSEQTVGEVLWDLADGAGGIADEDNDGVNLGPEGVMRAMMELTSIDGAFPCLTSFLRFLVASGRVGELELKEMLRRTGQDIDLLPTDGRSIWPEDITIPATVEGTIDGLSDPAPSGGPAHPSTGFDATKAYRFRLAERGSHLFSLSIAGSGDSSDRTNLDLEIRDIRARVIAQARSENPRESLQPGPMEPGWYVIFVRDAGQGNRASYRLTVQ